MSESKLEAELAFAMRAIGLPTPEREYHFDWCCECPKAEHGYAGSKRSNHWYHMPRTPWCSGCRRSHEYRHGRKWKADFAYPDRRILIEVEGGVYSGGRHVRGRGYEADAEKYSTASLAGWVVLRFTGRQVRSGEALNMIEEALREGS